MTHVFPLMARVAVVASLVTSVVQAGTLRAQTRTGVAPVADTIRGLAYDSLSWQPLSGRVATSSPRPSRSA